MAGTSADKLALLKATKAELKAALTEKGQTPGDKFADYPNMVRAIQTGGNAPYENGFAFVYTDGRYQFSPNVSGNDTVSIKYRSNSTVYFLPRIPGEVTGTYSDGSSVNISYHDDTRMYSALGIDSSPFTFYVDGEPIGTISVTLG